MHEGSWLQRQTPGGSGGGGEQQLQAPCFLELDTSSTSDPNATRETRCQQRWGSRLTAVARAGVWRAAMLTRAVDDCLYAADRSVCLCWRLHGALPSCCGCWVAGSDIGAAIWASIVNDLDLGHAA